MPVVLDCECPGDTTYIEDRSENLFLSYQVRPFYGFYLPTPVVQASVGQVAPEQYRLEMQVVGTGGGYWEDCFDGWNGACPTPVSLPPRMLSEFEVTGLRNLLKRFQIDAAAQPGCEYDNDPVNLRYLNGFWDDALCEAPSLRWDQYARAQELLDQYLAGY